MIVTIPGGTGMLGRDLARVLAAAGIEVRALASTTCDVRDRASVARQIAGADIVINCAAFTRVDDAETEREISQAVNVAGAGTVAACCAEQGIRMFHIGSDYVFDGESDRPYRENDATGPLSAYGTDKLDGEIAVLDALPTATVVRTQALFGVHGRHFVRAIMAACGRADEAVRVIDDQSTCPTYTGHLAVALQHLIAVECSGVVHASASGSCSWYELACAIAARTGSEWPIEAVPTSAYPTPARRPLNAVLDKSLYESLTGHCLPSWREGLDAYLEEAHSRIDA